MTNAIITSVVEIGRRLGHCFYCSYFNLYILPRKRLHETIIRCILNFSMNTTRFIKSFSKGQITIPKEFRDLFGIGDEFWLKLSVEDGKLVAEPVERDKTRGDYSQ